MEKEVRKKKWEGNRGNNQVKKGGRERRKEGVEGGCKGDEEVV